MVTGAEEAAAVKAAVAIVQMAQKQGWLDKLIDLFKARHTVLVVGSTGVGKSNFITSLQKVVPAAIDRMNRTNEVKRAEVIRLAGDIFEFVDTPGQDNHKTKRLNIFTKILASQQPFGVINVVSAGFHEYRVGSSEALTDQNTVSVDWLSTHRTIELVMASEWASLMTARPEYVITVVSKADLWWSDREKILKEYDSGEYFKIIRDAAIKGHIVLPYSSVNHMFYDMAPMAGTFETADREACQREFLKSLFMLTAK